MQTKSTFPSSDFCPSDDMLSPRSQPHPLRSPKRQTLTETSGLGQKTEIQSKTEKIEEFF